jgi:hypothetical protein
MKTPLPKPNTAPETPPETEATEALARYQVAVPTVILRGVIAYCGARVNLTPTHAAALNAAQPGTVSFLGI